MSIYLDNWLLPRCSIMRRRLIFGDCAERRAAESVQLDTKCHFLFVQPNHWLLFHKTTTGTFSIILSFKNLIGRNKIAPPVFVASFWCKHSLLNFIQGLRIEVNGLPLLLPYSGNGINIFEQKHKLRLTTRVGNYAHKINKPSFLFQVPDFNFQLFRYFNPLGWPLDARDHGETGTQKLALWPLR